MVTRYDRWAKDHDACLRCGKTTRAHRARGYCDPCYGALYRAAEFPETNLALLDEWVREGGARLAEETRRELEAHDEYERHLLETEWVWWHESAMTTIPSWGM